MEKTLSTNKHSECSHFIKDVYLHFDTMKNGINANDLTSCLFLCSVLHNSVLFNSNSN